MKIAIVAPESPDFPQPIISLLTHQSGRVQFPFRNRTHGSVAHANTVEVESERSTEQVDTRIHRFQPAELPGLFTSMLELEVTSRPSNMSFSVSDGSAFQFTGRNLAGVFADRRNLLRPGFPQDAGEVPVFQRRMRQLVESEAEITPDGSWPGGVFDAPSGEVVVPMVASVWSAGDEAMSKFPPAFWHGFSTTTGF